MVDQGDLGEDLCLGKAGRENLPHEPTDPILIYQ